MLRLDEDTYQRVITLIERYELHSDHAALPVPIRQVARDEGWEVQFRPRMGQALALAFVVGPVKLMYVNCNVAFSAQQQAIAHEIGHVLACHNLGLDTFMAMGHEREGLRRVRAQQEMEANLIAAMLLIPDYLRDAPISDCDLGKLCGVNSNAIRVFRSMVRREPELMMLTG